ncbi:MAG: hypothetical protein OES47_13480 [Acidobacteriota bacterium]|nr:hypothetical protein [Acidobacteriota bacterium]
MSEAETPTPPPPPEEPSSGSGGQSSNRGLMVALSYLWLLALVPLLVEKDDAEVQWHAKHGIVLMVAEIGLWIVFALLSMVLGPLACALAIFQLLIFLAILVVHVICIVKGVNGERFLLPGISQYADRF